MKRRRTEKSGAIAELLHAVPSGIERMRRRGQWKRKMAAAIVVTMLTGTFTNGLTVTGPPGKAYAYATASDAQEDDIWDEDLILEEDLPDKGESSDYYLEDANEVDLVISEKQIQDALEEEEPELDPGLLGYEDPRAVVGLYEEIQEAADGYRLVDQGTLAEDTLSYFVYVREDASGDDLFRELFVIAVNPSDAADGDSGYNVFLKYNGEKYRLETGNVQLKSIKALSREQLKAEETEEDEPVIKIELTPAGSTGGGGTGSGSGSGHDSVVTVITDEKGSQESEAAGSGDAADSGREEDVSGAADQGSDNGAGTSTDDGADSGSGMESGSGSENTDSADASDDRDSAGASDSTNDGAASDDADDADTSDDVNDADTSDGTDDADASGNTDDGDSTDVSDNTDDGDSADASNDADGADTSDDTDNADTSGGTDDADTSDDADNADTSDDADDAGASGDTDDGDTSDNADSADASDDTDSSGSSDSGSSQGEKLSLGIKSVYRVMAAVASLSNADAKDLIAELKKELKEQKKSAFKLEDSGSFEMSALEMKIINQDDPAVGDAELEDEEDLTVTAKAAKVFSMFGGDDAADDEIGSEAGDYSSAIGLRANTIAMFRADSRNVPQNRADGLDWSTIPVYEGETAFYYGMEYPADSLLPESGTITDSDGTEYRVALTDVTRTVNGTADQWLWGGGAISVDSDAIDSYTLIYTAYDEDSQPAGTWSVTAEAKSVAFTLPDFKYFVVNNTYDLMEEELKAEDKDGNRYNVRLRSVTRTLVSGKTDDWNWEDEGKPTSITVDRSDIVEYSIVYEAYTTDGSGREVVTGISDPLTVLVHQSGGVGATVDRAGDVAYVTAEYVPGSLRTGTAPWDDAADPANPKPGEDTTDEDNRLRTFDTASFNVSVRSTVRPGSPYSHYENGTLCYELILPGSEEQVCFDEGGMSWLKAKPYSNYEIISTTWEGKPAQVLRGSFLWEPSDNNPSAIGESYLELNVAYRALKMKNGDIVKPLATFWLGINDVAEGAELELKGDDETGSAVGYQFPDGLVTGSGSSCAVHGEEEFDTVEAEPVEITAAPRYNASLVFNGRTQTALGSFDFSTGNDKAPNKSNYVVKEGRIGCVGVVLQIQGKPNMGLKGVELPDENEAITFDLKLSSDFVYEKNNKTYDLGGRYLPLLWSAEGNRNGTDQSDGRVIPGNVSSKGSTSVPLNTGGNYNSCYNGGTWTAVQENDTIHVTVEGFKVSTDLSKIPNTYNGAGSAATATYYNPATMKNYWDLSTLCFSAGEFWIVQPFYRIDADGNEILILDDEELLGADAHGTAGLFRVNAEDVKLRMQSISGQKLEEKDDNSNQANTRDDRGNLSYDYRMPGSFDTQVRYIEYHGYWGDSPLTEGCLGNGQDWATLGTKMDLHVYVGHDSKDGEYCGVAYDSLIKFDNAMFQPEFGSGATSGAYRQLYAAYKYDPIGGWPHGDLGPDDAGYDDVMKAAGLEDLVFFTKEEFERLQNEEGYQCVAVLGEWRGDYSSQMTHNHFYVRGSVKLDPDLAGHVYMISQSVRGWRRLELEALAREYLNKPEGELTGADWTAYAINGFPSQLDKENNGNGYANYPAYGLRDEPSQEGSPILAYQKTRYNEDGTLAANGDKTSAYWGDSCRIVGYRGVITKDTAQTTVSNYETVTKKYYDLDGSQRIADYVLRPEIQRTSGTGQDGEDKTFSIQELVITDILPKGLTYIAHSGYQGGTYTMTGEGKQGTVTGGTQIEPDVEIRQDGSSVLVWRFPDVEVSAVKNTPLPEIHYSCDIGNIGAEDDVQNNQQLLNTVTIGGTGLSADYKVSNENKAELSIYVNKNQATSLSKVADQVAVEVGQTMGFQLRVGNNAENAIATVAYDKMPYVGDGTGTSFDGEIYLKALKFDTIDPEVIKKLLGTDPNNLAIKFYYTMDETYRHKDSSDFVDESKNADMDAIRNSNDWIMLDVDYDPENPLATVIHLPSDTFSPVAIAAVGMLPGGTTLPLHTLYELSDPKPGDYIGTTLSNRDMQSTARSFVLNRLIEGLAWFDENNNGMRESAEKRLNGVNVTIHYVGSTKEGSSAAAVPADVMILTGQRYDFLTGETETYNTDGAYQFNNVPEGIYEIKFTSGTGDADLSYYWGTDSTGVTNMEINSDAVPRYDDDASLNKKLEYSLISGIRMPRVTEIQTMTFASRHNDAGFVVPKGSLKFTKTDSKNGSQLQGAEFELKGTSAGTDPTFAASAEDLRTFISTYAKQAGIELESFAIGAGGSSFTMKFTATDGAVDFGLGDYNYKELPRGEYVLTELKTPDGYKFPDGSGLKDGKTFTIPDADSQNPMLIDFTGADSLVNVPQEFKIKKVSKPLGNEAEIALPGAEFRIYEGRYGADALESMTPVKTITSGADGYAVFDMTGLKKGQPYTVLESKAPVGYDAVQPFYFTLIEEGSAAGGETLLRPVADTGANENLAVITENDEIVMKVSDPPVETKITVRKVWIDNDNAYGTRPNGITVELKADGNRKDVKAIYHDKSENVPQGAAIGSYTWEKLPKYDGYSGREIVYTVEEVLTKNGYDTTVPVRTENGSEVIFTITNTIQQKQVEVKGTKTWYGKYDAGDEQTAVIYLYRDDDAQTGEPYRTTTVTGDSEYSFTELDKYDLSDGHAYSYTVKEVPVTGYTPVQNGNDFKNISQETTNVSGTKTWYGADGSVPEVTIQLFNGIDSEACDTAVLENGETSYSFENLPVYHPETGERYTYTVKEVPVTGYTTVQDGSSFKNISQEKTKLEGYKSWAGLEEAAPEVTIELYDSRYTAPIDTTTVNSATGYYIFDDLDVYDQKTGEKITYSVKEIPVTGYTTVQNGNNFLNISQKTTRIAGKKTWYGLDSAEAEPTVTIELYNEGDPNVIAVTTVDPATHEYSFENLPVYNQTTGELFRYYVKEVEIPGFTSVKSGNDFSNISQETTRIEGEKFWYGVPDGDEEPEVTIELHNGVNDDVITTMVDPATHKYSFENLPLYDQKTGEKYEYSVTEVKINGYHTVQDGNDFKNISTRKTSIKGKKTWIGLNGEAPDVIIKLYNGIDPEPVAETRVDKTANTYEFADLWMYDQETGAEFNYRTEEVPVEGYTSIKTDNDYLNISEEKIKISGTKVWDDKHDTEGIRPSDIELVLTQKCGDKEVVLNVEPDWKKPQGGDTWTWTYTDLQKYNLETGEEYQYSVEERIVPEGYTVVHDSAENRITNTLETGELQIIKLAGAGTDLSDKVFYFTVKKDGRFYDLDGMAHDELVVLSMDWDETKLISIPDLAAGTYEVAEVADEDGNAVTADFPFVVQQTAVQVTVPVNDRAGTVVTNTQKFGFFDVTARKELAGRKLEAGQFLFKLTDQSENIVATASNAEDGSISFHRVALPVYDGTNRYDYLISEMVPEDEDKVNGYEYSMEPYAVTVLITPGEDDPELQTQTEYHVEDSERVFHNTYRIASASTWISGIKQLKGTETDNWKKEGWFRFNLRQVVGTASDWTAVDGGYAAEAVTDENGTFAFELVYEQADLELLREKTYYYMVTEQELSEDRAFVTYDRGWYVAAVTVADDGAGHLIVSDPELVAGSGDISGGEVVFENTYSAKGQIAFQGSKALHGRVFNEDDVFRFRLMRDHELVDSAEIRPLESGAAFTLGDSFDETDIGREIVYSISEENGGKTIDGITYSSTVWSGTYEIVDNGDGTLTAVYVSGDDLSGELEFINVYRRGNAEFTPKFRKTMSGRQFRDTDVFTFTLVRTDPNGTVTTKQKEIRPGTGRIFDGAFDTDVFGMSDIGKTYRYEIYEEKGNIARVTYDSAHYLIDVTITDEGNENLTLTAVCEGEVFDTAEFTNRYSSGGGGGGGGSTPDPKPDPDPTPDPGPTPDPDPTPGTPDSSYPGRDDLPPGIVFENLVPLGGGYYRNPADGSIIYIGDEDVPLLGLARTGDRGSTAEAVLLLVSAIGIAVLTLFKRRKKQ